MSAAGTALLVAVLVLSALAAGLAAARRTAAARALVVAAAGAGLAAFAILEIALLLRVHDLGYVDRVIEPGMPAYYRATAAWAALEGSLLLWLVALAAVAAIFALRRSARPPERSGAAALGVLAAGVALFAGVSLLASPFSSAAGDGPPPSPLLQDHPAMGIHPPLLYAGFVTLAVPYALAVGAAAGRDAGAAWARVVRVWLLVAWILLTAGIAVGAWWSYAVLGWGGYWAWDPVENASLMPWLLATAGIHAVAPGAGRARSPRWPVALAGLPFVFVLLATFLTRSGLVESIHAFSVSPLGPALLVLLLLGAGGWISVAAIGARVLPAARESPLLSRGGALSANHLGMLLATAIVLLGSVLPAIALATTGARITVGPPWYERTLAPLALGLLVIMALAPWAGWRSGGLRRLLSRVAVPGAAAAVAGALAGVVTRDAALSVAVALAGFMVASLAIRLTARQRGPGGGVGGLISHLGVALVAVALVAGSHAVVAERTIPIGGSVTAGETTAVLVGLSTREEARRTIVEARLLVAARGDEPVEARPELRYYPEHATIVAGPDIRSEPLRDVYVTLLDVDGAAGTATVRIAVEPLVSWLWGAIGVLMAGAVFALLERRARRRPRRGSAPGGARGLRARLGAGAAAGAVLLVALTGCAAPVEVGEAAPALSGDDLSGDPLDLADFRGSVVIVTVWASWCGPCRDEVPVLREALDRHADDGLAVLGISFRDNPEAARAFAERESIVYPSIVDQRGERSVEWAVAGIPQSFLIDRDGVLVDRHFGAISRSWIDEVVVPELTS